MKNKGKKAEIPSLGINRESPFLLMPGEIIYRRALEKMEEATLPPDSTYVFNSKFQTDQ